MTYNEYRAIDAVNWSSLKVMGVSPLQYWHELNTPREDASHFRIGLAIHAIVLEPSTVKSAFAIYEDGNRRGKKWDAFKAEHAGLHILTEPEWSAALGSAAAVMANPHASALLKRGLKEAVLQWTDEETGLACKARVDHAGRSLIDLKSSRPVSQRSFAAAAARLGYHGQFAFYEDGLRANGIEPADAPHMIVVHSEMPHDVVVYRMGPQVIDTGRQEYRALLEKLKRCRETNQWPGAAPDGPVDFVLPAWATMDDEEAALTIGGLPMEIR